MGVPPTNSVLSNCLILSVISWIAMAQVSQGLTRNPCIYKSTCHECIQTPSCAWCSDPNFRDTVRCFQPSSGIISDPICREEFVNNPHNALSVLENLQLSRTTFASGGDGGTEGGQGNELAHERIVNVSPQRLKLKLRARQTYSVNMYYSQAEGYPVDLYYLVDLSKSMEDHKSQLKILGDKLANAMKNLTSNFRLGFGSFRLIKHYEQYPAFFEFHHHMSLSNNTHEFSKICSSHSPIFHVGYMTNVVVAQDETRFQTSDDARNIIPCPQYTIAIFSNIININFRKLNMVKQANISGNVNTSEGGFDAIVQAIVCRKDIGWREKSRRLLVFASTATFNFAEDEKFADRVNPNDGHCHLSRDGIYTKSPYQKHSSIEQINLSVKKNSVNVIFAVTNSSFSIFEELARKIEGAYVFKLEGDSSSIVELIKHLYQYISSILEMQHNASSDISLKFYTRCMDSTGALVNTKRCGNVKPGDLIHFKIDIEILKCPKDPADYFQTIRIYPIGIFESLIIDLEMLCECDCEKPGHLFYQVNSSFCFHHGTFKCGICECMPGAFGRKCECQLGDTVTDCFDPKNPHHSVCSGRGQCVCGHCECEMRSNFDEVINGRYCECDNFSCDRHQGRLCSDHGICECGLCLCHEGWTGPSCSCKKSKADCYLPGSDNTTICSGHGVCECGRCLCDHGKYGKFCEKCPTCPDRCEELKDCVQCQMYKTGRLKESADCISNCTKFVPIPADKVVANDENNEVICASDDEDGCRFTYVYYFDSDHIQVRAQQKRVCPLKVT